MLVTNDMIFRKHARAHKIDTVTNSASSRQPVTPLFSRNQCAKHDKVMRGCAGSSRMFGPTAAALSWHIAAALAITPMAAQTTGPDGNTSTDAATATLVSGILSYSDWPTNPVPVRLCVTGNAPQTARFANSLRRNGQNIVLSRLAPSAATPANCHVVYIGQMAPSDRSRLIMRLGGTAVLTITDADPECEYGAMFCIHATPQGVEFDLNVGAVAYSQVRVDPRVLALSSRFGGARR